MDLDRTVTGFERLRVMRVIARMNVGGPARQVEVLARQLNPDRFDQRLLTGSVGPEEVDDLALRGVDLPHERVRGLGRDPSPADDGRALMTLVAAMRQFRPHVVHTHTAKAGALGRIAAMVSSAGRPSRRPALVHTFHGHILHGYFSARATRAVVQVERRLAGHTDRLVAVGVRVRDDLLDAGIGTVDKWAVVPPGVELTPFDNASEARGALGLPVSVPVVAFVGRLTAVKRPDRLVAVAARVLATHPDAIFVVAGDGDQASALRRAAATAGVADRLRMLGWRRDVERIYSAADVVLLTSDNEGMPVSLIEAGLAARPAVTTAVGSAAEVIIDGETGLVVAPDDVDGLARAVERLFGDADLRRSMGTAAARWANQRFSGARLVADTERLYSELARERGYWH